MAVLKPPSADIQTNPARLYEYLRLLHRDMAEQQAEIRELRKSLATGSESTSSAGKLDFADFQQIRAELQLGGSAPLDLNGLRGKTGQPQLSAPVTAATSATLPAAAQYPLGTLGVTTTSPSQLYYVERSATGGHVWASVNIAPAHALLSSSHSDTVAASPVQGDLIVGNATPKWARLARGTAKTGLRINAAGTDPEWSSAVLMGDTTQTGITGDKTMASGTWDFSTAGVELKAVTQAAADNDSSVATTAFVKLVAAVKTTGSAIGIGSGVATTVLSAATAGRYDIVAFVGTSGVNYEAFATVVSDSATPRIVANNGANLTITLAGTNVQVTQTSGAAQTVFWGYIYF